MMNRSQTLATVSFQTHPLTVIQELMERRVELINEIDKLELCSATGKERIHIARRWNGTTLRSEV
jgi:hypothetical protein